MPDPQTPILWSRVAARPRCPKCQSRMAVQHITSARSGFEHWTLRCIKCGLVHEAQVNVDPMTPDPIGWERPESATVRRMT
jgi:transcription elongation factor Elf1